MNRNKFIRQQRGGIKGILFPHSINRTGLLLRAIIIGLFAGLPLRGLYKSSESKITALTFEAILLAAPAIESGSIDVEKFDDKAIQRLEKIQNGIQQNRVLMLGSITLSFAVYILSFGMMFIPRVRHMGQSPKLAWLMAIPVVNTLFAWVLIFAPPKY